MSMVHGTDIGARIGLAPTVAGPAPPVRWCL